MEGDEQVDALERATAAAAAGDAPGMLKALAESRMLDGLNRMLQQSWKQLDVEDRHAVIGQAVDAMYDAVREGQRVLSPGAYLYRTTLHLADKRHKDKLKIADPSVVDALPSGQTEGSGDADTGEAPASDAPEVVWDEARRTEAVARLRQLVPQTGGPSIQKVLAVILDALERGIPSITNKELGEATGLTQGNVRKCKMRGLRRLERLARAAALGDAALRGLEAAAKDGDDEEEVDDDG